MVRERPGLQDFRVKQIREHKLKGHEACTQLLESVELTAYQELSANSQNPWSNKILNTFQDLHYTWFKHFALQESYFDFATNMLYDPGEMALAVTRALFDNQIPLKNIFLENQPWEAIRRPQENPKYFIFQHQNIERPRYIMGTKGGRWNPTPVALGNLVGIKKIPPKRDILIWASTLEENEHLQEKINLDIHRPYGGGIIGSVPYLLLNLGRMRGERADGGFYLPRRWVQSIFNDFLCRDLPVIQWADAAPFVNPSSKLPFKKNQDCMKCHATLDPLAQVARNFEMIYSGVEKTPYDPKDFISRHVRQHFVTLPELKEPTPDRDKDFYLRPPTGRLYFRDYKGQLIDQTINGLDELGKSLSELEDFYLCYSLRYFNFLTGKKLTLQDILNSPSSPLSTKMISLSQELKKKQNTKLIIEEIFKWEEFLR